MAIDFLKSQIKVSDPMAVEFVEQLIKLGVAYGTKPITTGFITSVDGVICGSELPWLQRDIIASNEYGEFYVVPHKHSDRGFLAHDDDSRTTIEVDYEKLKMTVYVLNTLNAATSKTSVIQVKDMDIDKIYHLALNCLGNAAAR